jgi:hypothetical protein
MVSNSLQRRIMAEQCFKCNECKEPLGADFEFDHITRRSDGGSNDRDNLQALCHPCHDAKTRREQAANPVGTVVLAARERRAAGVLKRKVDEMLARDTQQQWGYERIERLLDWIKEEDLVPAAFNRQPVWGLKAQQEFILVLLNNKITAPLYIMRFSNSSRMELYDGINRMHAIQQFVNGEIYVKIDKDMLYFARPHGSAAGEMTEQQRKLFLRRDVQVAWWQNLDECEACDMALKLNSGTAANMSERLKWITGIATSRCKLLTRLSKTDVGCYFLELKERTVLFSWMGEIVLRTVENSWPALTLRVVQYNVLEEFFRDKGEVVDEEGVFETCHAILCKVRTFLNVVEELPGFNVAQLQLLLAAFHRTPDMEVTAWRYRAWNRASKRKRMYSNSDFQEALHAFTTAHADDELVADDGEDDDEE